MEAFDNLVLPQSGESLSNLHFLLILAKMIFLVYSGTLFGSTIFSVYFNMLGKSNYSPNQLKLSRDLIDLITSSSFFAVGLGIVPMISIILIYIQLLSGTAAPVLMPMMIAFALYMIALVLIYQYKKTLHLANLFGYFDKKLNEDDDPDTVRQTREILTESKAQNNSISIWTVVFLLASIYLFVASWTMAGHNVTWENTHFFFDVLLSGAAIAKTLHFLSAGFAITGGAFIVKHFFWDKYSYDMKADYAALARKFNLSIALIFTAVQPIFLMLNIILTPNISLSYFMYSLTLIVIFLMFLVVHLFYQMLKRDHHKYAVPAFWMVLFIASFIVVKEQVAFSVSNQEHLAEMAQDYEEYHAELLAAAGQTEPVDGAELYNTVCTSCHLEQDTKAAPSHNSVMPKYIGKKEELVNYIMNPVKVDPNYPAMPKQQLKPNEVEAIAEFMLEKFGNEENK